MTEGALTLRLLTRGRGGLGLLVLLAAAGDDGARDMADAARGHAYALGGNADGHPGNGADSEGDAAGLGQAQGQDQGDFDGLHVRLLKIGEAKTRLRIGQRAPET